MSRTITSLGGPPPTANRTLTFGSDWSKFDQAFADRGFPWHYIGNGPSSASPQSPGQQTLINGESQYYVKPSELLAASAAPGWDNGRPWNVNDDGNLLLRAIKTPSAYVDIAYGVINAYEVISTSGNDVRVKGLSYYARDARQSRVGIDKFYRAKYTGQPLRLKAGNSVVEINSITDESVDGSGNDPTSGNTTHVIRCASLPDRPVAGDRVNVLRPLEYVSGMATTRGTFSQKYGSWQMRCKFGSGKGAFAALWSWPNYNEWFSGNSDTEIKFQQGDKDQEIDFGECLGHAPDIFYHNAHSPNPYLLPFKNGVRSMRGYVEDNGLTPFYPGAPGWTGDQIQQHQVLLGGPSSSDYYTGDDWLTIRWDWYTDNTCAWFVKRDSWPDFRKVANMYMTPHTFNNVIDARCWFINNAVAGDFNYEQERNDASYPRLVNTVPTAFDFEVDYLRTYQWDGEPNGGSGHPNRSGVYPTGFGTTPGNGDGASSGSGPGDGGTNPGTPAPGTPRGYVPSDTPRILFRPGHTEETVQYEVSSEIPGRWDWSAYGSDATLVGDDTGPVLTLRTGPVATPTRRTVRFVPD